jgi:DNA-binding MarR family transcriptional regulator
MAAPYIREKENLVGMRSDDYGDKCACSATALRKAARRVSQLYDSALAPAGLTVTQFALLTELLRRGDKAPSVTELAAAMVMDRSGLGHTLHPLQRDGLIALAVNDRDARSRQVVLTVRGKARQQKAVALWSRAQRQFAEVVGPGDAAKLQATLLSIAHDERLGV